MVLKLYKMDPSPPARACMIVCEILNVPVEMIDVNVVAGEQYKPEFAEVRTTNQSLILLTYTLG